MIATKTHLRSVFLALSLALFAWLPATGQTFALKTNALYDLACTPTLEAEAALGQRTTVNLLGAYNPWTWSDGKKLRFVLLQPELRHWTCGKYEGHFFGVHAHGAKWFGCWDKTQRDGWMAGAGLSYGYDWIISKHWNIEASIGLGYARLWWKENDKAPCIKERLSKHKDYWGPTKLSLDIVYLF